MSSTRLPPEARAVGLNLALLSHELLNALGLLTSSRVCFSDIKEPLCPSFRACTRTLSESLITLSERLEGIEERAISILLGPKRGVTPRDVITRIQGDLPEAVALSSIVNLACLAYETNNITLAGKLVGIIQEFREIVKCDLPPITEIDVLDFTSGMVDMINASIYCIIDMIRRAETLFGETALKALAESKRWF